MKRDHSKLLCDISELSALFTDTSNLDGLLQNIVEMVAQHMEADVCSIYLYYEEQNELVLRATKGLTPSSVGNVHLKPGEGLTGVAFQELRTVSDGDTSKNVQYKHITGIGEERFASFMAVPILRGQTRIGVMTLQSEKKNFFLAEDANVFRAITSQMATIIEMTKMLISLQTQGPISATGKNLPLKLIKGRVGAEGVAYGPVALVIAPSWESFSLQSTQEPMTLQDLRKAVVTTEKELALMQHQIEEKLFDVASLIFSAQILMLKDHVFLGTMEDLVRSGVHPVEAVRRVVHDYAGRFARMSNSFIREKQYDVMDVGRRLLDNLAGSRDRSAQLSGKIVVARELLPSEALKLKSQNVAGIVLLSGGVTSHVSVLARSFNIPLVIADAPALLEVPEGTQILIDGNIGNIFVDPDSVVVAQFRDQQALKAAAAAVHTTVKPETCLSDGVRVHLLANINLLGDAAVAEDYRAEGVGLYRTEFPFIVRSDFPAEEEQYVIYRRLVEMMKGRELTFRTLDIGGDKMLSYYDHAKEANPFLGLRSIRFSLRHKEIFVQQLRAILRAAAGPLGRGVRIMFPMISSLEEFLEAKAMVVACERELALAHVPHQAKLMVGMMVELPSVTPIIDEFAGHADFFSIGTNDLIQYTLAVDRTNDKVADLYNPHHPAVLRFLEKIAASARDHGRDISVCGDMAHDPLYIPFLVGIGIRKFSLDARYIPKIQARLSILDTTKAVAHAREILAMTRMDQIEQALKTMEQH
jgi:phosphotransferase system enzyme I (PtsP)